MGPNGEQVRRVFDMGLNNYAYNFRWSPTGQRLAYIKCADSSIESRDLRGGLTTTLLSDVPGRLQDYVWLPDGRIVYALAEPRPNNDTCNLWERRVDTPTGQPRGQPRRLTNWAGFCLDNMTASADGKRLAFEEWAGHASVFIADIQSNGKRITAPSRLTLSDSWNVPSAWTPDSKAVVFSSRFNSQEQIVMQRLDEDTAKPIVTALANVSDHAPLSPDGLWFLYTTRSTNAQPMEVMRVPAIGGPPQLVMMGGSDGVRCAKPPEALCAVAERSPAGTQLAFTAFDPLKARGRELLKFDTSPDSDYNWDLSPDATRIAILKSLTGEIYVLSLAGQPTMVISIESASTSNFLDWAADGKGVFVSRPTPRGFALLYVDLHGQIHPLWEQEGGLGVSALPSPDGRHLAIRGWNVNSNIWMIENF
jgi:Tol biopolymer transport system component